MLVCNAVTHLMIMPCARLYVRACAHTRARKRAACTCAHVDFFALQALQCYKWLWY